MTATNTVRTAARIAALSAALAAPLAAAAGDDVKNIAIGTGAGLIGKMLRGEPLTIEGTLKSAVGATVGSQIGDGSGATVGAVVGGVGGETVFDGVAGILQGDAAGGAASGAAVPAGGALGQVAGYRSAAPPVAAVLREGAAGTEACDTAACYPARVAAAPAVLVRSGNGYLACVGSAGGLDCYPLAGAGR